MDTEIQKRLTSALARSAGIKQRSATLLAAQQSQVSTILTRASNLSATISGLSENLRAKLDDLGSETAGLVGDVSRGNAQVKECLGEIVRLITTLGEHTTKHSGALLDVLESSLEDLHEEMVAVSEEAADSVRENLDELLGELTDELLPEVEAKFDERRDSVMEDADEVVDQVRDHAEAFEEMLGSAWDELEGSLNGNIGDVMNSFRDIGEQARSLAEQIQQLTETVADGHRTLDSTVDATSQGAGGAIRVVTDTIDIFRQIT